MSVSDYFSTFCSNLRMDSDTVSTIQYRYQQIPMKNSMHTKVMDSQRCYRKLREFCKRLIVHHT